MLTLCWSLLLYIMHDCLALYLCYSLNHSLYSHLKHPYYVTCIMYCRLPDSLDMTHHIWCLGIIIDLVPEGEAFPEALLANEYWWGRVYLEVALEDGEPALGALVISSLGFEWRFVVSIGDIYFLYVHIIFSTLRSIFVKSQILRSLGPSNF